MKRSYHIQKTRVLWSFLTSGSYKLSDLSSVMVQTVRSGYDVDVMFVAEYSMYSSVTCSLHFEQFFFISPSKSSMALSD
ncbi:hypothetical protein H671_8g18880 [Cricetulus griseus]|nr:hypothetical protein H671_8g18880 [Cricetulus griseus]